MRTLQGVARLIAFALASLWIAPALTAQTTQVRIDRLATDDGHVAIAQLASGALDDRFSAQSYATVTPEADRSVWYRLRLGQDWSAEQPPVLRVADPQGLHIEVFAPPAYTAAPYSIYDEPSQSGFSRHALMIVLPAALRADTAVYLRVAPARPLAHGVAILDEATAHVEDLARARLDVLFPAIQLASLLIMLAFFMALRERMYIFFVGHVCFLVLYELYEFGIGYEFAPLDLLAPLRDLPTWLLATVAAILLGQFSRQFLDLRESTPRIDSLLDKIVWPLALLGACAAVPALSFGGWTVNALLLGILCLALLLLVAALLTWQDGSRRAGFYLCAWLPGLLLVIVRVLQLIAEWPQPSWLQVALPASFAFANIVLAFALADHTLTVRHERDVAHRLAEHDMLTGVLNRRAIEAAARAMFRHARATGELLSLLFLDIDHFKNVNDTHGHRSGDRCLRAITVPITDELRHEDALGRYGGEEFLIVLPRTTRIHAEAIAERIRRRVEKVPIHVSGIRIGLTVSIGVACISDDVTCVEDLIESADSALYRAKFNGRNRVHTDSGPSVKPVGSARA